MAVTVEVNVTQEDINKGVRQNGSSCAIARRLTKLGFEDVNVGGSDDMHIGEEELVVSEPVTVDRFIERFDENRKSVKPFKFHIKVPESVIEGMGKISKALKEAIVKCDRKLNVRKEG